MAATSDYRKAYNSAKQELSDLVEKQEEIEKRIVIVRKSLETLASLCESEGVEVEPSVEANFLLENSTLADEIRAIFKATHANPLRPNEVLSELVKLGHDMGKYQNPQATIHMILKRMMESGELREGNTPEGKKTYASTRPSRIVEAFRNAKKGRFNSERFNRNSFVDR